MHTNKILLITRNISNCSILCELLFLVLFISIKNEYGTLKFPSEIDRLSLTQLVEI